MKHNEPHYQKEVSKLFMELVFLIFPLHTFVLFSRKAIFYFPKLDQPLFSRKREQKTKIRKPDFVHSLYFLSKIRNLKRTIRIQVTLRYISI